MIFSMGSFSKENNFGTDLRELVCFLTNDVVWGGKDQIPSCKIHSYIQAASRVIFIACCKVFFGVWRINCILR